MAKINVILAVLLTILICLSYYLFSTLQETKTVLAKYQATDQLNQQFGRFLLDFTRANFKKYLTGQALEKYTQAEKEQNQTSLEGINAISKTNFKQLFVKLNEIDKDQAEAYGIVEIHYNIANDPKAMEYIQNLAVNANWIKTKEGWKVDTYQVSLLEDTRDQLLEKQAQGK